MTAREFADKIWGTEDLKDISEFNITLDSAISMMEKFAEQQQGEVFYLPSTLKNMLDNLVKAGGYIVSTNELAVSEITEASACGEMYVDNDGFGFARVGKLPEQS
jgi:hypothetical protein